MVDGSRWHGGGDAKLLALIGAFLGIEALPWIILISAGLGLVAGTILALRHRSGMLTPMPYGPFLILAAIIALVRAISSIISYSLIQPSS